MWTHKEGNQSDHKVINRAQIPDTLAGAITSQQLLLFGTSLRVLRRQTTIALLFCASSARD